MEVQVSFYGSLVRRVGGRTKVVRVPGTSPTVKDLRRALAREFPGLADHLSQVAVGMGAEIFPDDAALRTDQEVSLLPPVSGGQKDGVVPDGPRISHDPLSLDSLLQATEGVDAGALAVFAGTIRARDRERDVAALEYDVHGDMAERAIRDIETDLEAREGVLACRIVHRVGRVPAGEASVYVVVRARHRPEAFDAVREGIERVKREVPIWKEEVAADGTRRFDPSEEGASLRPDSGAGDAGADRGR